MIICEKPGYIQIVYHPDKNYIVFDWTNFMLTLAEIQELFAKTLAATQQNKCYYYIAETSKVRNVLREDVVQWWGQVWVPKLVATGLRAIVTVVPSSAMATLSTRTWQAEVVSGITMKNVKDFSEAESVIKELQQSARAK